MLLARGDSPITLTSLEQARQYRVGAYKGDAIALSLEKQGLAPVIVLRDQDNARKLQAGKSTCGPRVPLRGSFWRVRWEFRAQDGVAF